MKFNENKSFIYKSRYDSHDKNKINTSTKNNNKETQYSKVFHLPINSQKKSFFTIKKPKIYFSIRKNSKEHCIRDKNTENLPKFRKINKNNINRHTNFISFINDKNNNTYNKIIEQNNNFKN